MKFLIIGIILLVFLHVSNSQDEPNNPCKNSPCGNGICHVDNENR